MDNQLPIKLVAGDPTMTPRSGAVRGGGVSFDKNNKLVEIRKYNPDTKLMEIEWTHPDYAKIKLVHDL